MFKVGSPKLRYPAGVKLKLMVLLLLAGSALADNLPLTPALKIQISAAARAFTGQPCTENFIAKRKAVPSAEFAKLYLQAGQQATRQPGFKLNKEVLSPDGLTYRFSGFSDGRTTFMLTRYDAQAGVIYYSICNQK